MNCEAEIRKQVSELAAYAKQVEAPEDAMDDLVHDVAQDPGCRS